MIPVRADHKVLVIASDPMLAAMVGRLVEGTSFQAAFPRDAERPEEALARVRPIAAVLVDAVVDEAESDLFFVRARRRHIPVLLFGSLTSMENRQAWARSHRIPTFVLPGDSDGLRNALERLHEPADRSRGAERRVAHTERDTAGRLVLEDAKGTRWSIYDRRSTDRGAAAIDREFVSDTGRVRRCSVPATEADALSVKSLLRQLARARAVRD